MRDYGEVTANSGHKKSSWVHWRNRRQYLPPTAMRAMWRVWARSSTCLHQSPKKRCHFIPSRFFPNRLKEPLGSTAQPCLSAVEVQQPAQGPCAPTPACKSHLVANVECVTPAFVQMKPPTRAVFNELPDGICPPGTGHQFTIYQLAPRVKCLDLKHRTERARTWWAEATHFTALQDPSWEARAHVPALRVPQAVTHQSSLYVSKFSETENLLISESEWEDDAVAHGNALQGLKQLSALRENSKRKGERKGAANTITSCFSNGLYFKWCKSISTPKHKKGF